MSDSACDVLVVTARRLRSDDHGAGVRTARIAEALAARYRVIVVEPEGGEPPPAVIDAITFPPGRDIILTDLLSSGSIDGRAVWRKVGPVRAAAEATRAPVVFWADSILASAGLRQILPDASHVVEFANIESRRFIAMIAGGSPKRRAFATLEAVKAMLWEQRLAARADAIVTLTVDDARALRTVSPKLLVRNGVSVLDHRPEPSSGTTVLAVGSWWYVPNRQGLLRFLAEDWPRVIHAVPTARLIVAGAGGPELVPDAPGGVEVMGFVPDLGELYARATVALAPARSGSGSQLKLVGALAHGRVVVGPPFLKREQITTLPVGALDATGDMAEAIIRLLDATTERHETEAAILQWCSQHTWQREAGPLFSFVDRALDRQR